MALAQAQAPRPAGPAQPVTPLVLAGRLVRVAGTDTVPVSGGWVTAHRVSMQTQGPMDSARADAAGRFRFRVARPESTTVYVVSADYAGIGYFSSPFSHAAREGAEAIDLLVFDTATAGPPLGIAIRHVVIERSGQGNARRVLDLIQVNNPGATTRVAPDSLGTVWAARLPEGAAGAALGPGELPESAVRFTPDGRVEVAAAFPPGQKQIVITYTLAADVRTLTIPVDQPTARLEVILEGDAAPLGGLTAGEPMTLEGRSFARYTAADLAAGATPGIRFARSGGRRGGSQPIIIAVLAAAAALAAGLIVQARRTRSAPVGAAAASAPAADDLSDAAIADAIVALDDRFAGRQADVPAAEWEAYERQRAALKAQLAARVAGT